MLQWKTPWIVSLVFALIACRSEPQPPKWDWSETLPNHWRAEQAIIVRDTLYFSNWGYTVDGSPESPIIAAFDLTTKKLLWHVERDVLIPMDSDGERLFILNHSGLEALSLKDGSTLWRVDVGSEGNTDYDSDDELMSRDGRVLFSDNRGHDSVIHAFNAQTGANVWTSSLDAPLDWFRPGLPPEHWDGYRAVNYDRSTLYVREFLRDSGTQDRFHFVLVALDATNGHRVWEFPFDTPVTRGDAPPGGASRPAVSERAVYFGAFGGVTYALDRETGKLLWRRELELSLPLYAEGLVLGITVPSAFIAIDPESGQVKWSLEHSGLYATDSMILSNGRLLVSSGRDDQRELAVADIQNGTWLSTMRPRLPDNCVDIGRALGLNGESLYLVTLNCVHRFQVSR